MGDILICKHVEDTQNSTVMVLICLMVSAFSRTAILCSRLLLN